MPTDARRRAPRARHPERGLTLTEVTIVMVLATIVLTGLVGFYLNSQATWLDGSIQAISQREVNLVVDAIRKRTRVAYLATVNNVPDAQHVQLDLAPVKDSPPEQTYSYWWDPADSLVHEGCRLMGDDRGPMLQSKVETFSLAVVDGGRLLRVVSLQVRTPQGHHIAVRTNVRLENGGLP
jgi:hypothetical protein